MLKLQRDLSPDIVNYTALEICGPTVSCMSVSERFTLTNTALEMGAKSAMVPFDEVTARYLKKVSKARMAPLSSDANASYEREIDVDVDYLTPQVGCPDLSNPVMPVEEAAGKRIDHVVLGSCANGRIDDLEIAARILRGRRIHRDVRMIIVPGSRKVLSEALDKGLIKTFIESGCVVSNPGCSTCLYTNPSSVAREERALTTTNRATVGMNNNSQIYSASPATASATALEGAIADPRKYDR
jgi:3-isopropylmalate/(R)-2-methylmalate dehydratase large subunit